MECDAWTMPLVIDLGGGVTGTSHGAFLPKRELGWDSNDPEHLPRGLGDYRIPRTALTDLQGNRLDAADYMPNKGKIRNEACTFNDGMNMYVCTGEDAYHYMHLNIENMDHDTMDRRLSPLAIITNKGPNGYVDLYNGPARQSWGERFGIFHTTVAAETTVDLNFMSTPPQHMRVALQGGNTNRKILLKIYNPIPQLLKVTRIDSSGNSEEMHPNGFDDDMKPASGTVETFTPTLSDAPGTNYQNRDEQTLFLVMEDGDYMYDITVTDQVLMSFGFPPVAVEDFFEEQIVENLANFFGIAMEDIRVVNVIREDTILEGNRRRRDTDSDAAIVGADFSITPAQTQNTNSTEVKSNLSNKLTELTSSAVAGDNTIMDAVFKDSGVNNTAIRITRVVPVVPDSTDTEAFAAFNEAMTERIAEGKVDVTLNTGITVADDMNLQWQQPDTVDERTAIYPSPKVSFLDENGDIIDGSAPSDPWRIEATLLNAKQDVTVLQGSTIASVFNGVADFSNLYIPNRDEDDVNRKYQLSFRIVHPQSLADKFSPVVSAEFIMSARQFTASASVRNADNKVEFGEDIEYNIQLTDNSGNLLQDSNWKGYDWFVQTDINDESSIHAIPPTGNANITYIYESDKVDENTYYNGQFFVYALLDGEEVPDSQILVNAEPVLVTKPVSSLTQYTSIQHFQLAYKDLNFGDIADLEQLKADFHNKLHKADQDYYIGELEIHSGSVIVEGTLYAKDGNSLADGLNSVLAEARKSQDFQNMRFSFDSSGCNYSLSANRVLGQATENTYCYGENGNNANGSNGAAGGQISNGNSPSSSTSVTKLAYAALKGWEIGLIVVCSMFQ